MADEDHFHILECIIVDLLLGALAPVLVVVSFLFYFFNVWRELKVIEWTALRLKTVKYVVVISLRFIVSWDTFFSYFRILLGFLISIGEYLLHSRPFQMLKFFPPVFRVFARMIFAD